MEETKRGVFEFRKISNGGQAMTPGDRVIVTEPAEAEARGLARFFKTAKVRRLIAYVVKEPRT